MNNDNENETGNDDENVLEDLVVKWHEKCQAHEQGMRRKWWRRKRKKKKKERMERKRKRGPQTT